MRKSNYRGRRIARNKPKPILAGIILVVLAGLAVAGWKGSEIYFRNHFARNTIIQGVDCSYLSVDKAINRISSELNQQSITLVFKDAQYEFQGEDFGITLNEGAKEALQSILKNQWQGGDEQHSDYTINDVVEVSNETTKATLSSIKELQEDQMVAPVDAYIKVQEDGTLAIEGEVIGSMIDFDKALSFCAESIENGETAVDFTGLIEMPKVLSTNGKLNETVNGINTILGAVINFEFADGSTYTLDKETTKTWVKVDEEGNYYVDMENVNSVVEELNKRAQDACETITFTPTDMTTPIAFSQKLKVEVDLEAEKQQIIQELIDGEKITREPIYKDGLEPRDLLSYIEVDITRQIVWVYIDGELVLITPCVTGKPPRHDTPTGMYYLSYKDSDENGKGIPLRGYNDNGTRYESRVKFWMPFNGGVGFHDASWQKQFGGDWYLAHGSHGCVNLPLEAAKTLYTYIDTTIPIFVYCS